MKTIKFIAVIFLILKASLIYSQATEITGDKSTYILEEVPGLYVVYNKSNTLMHTTPSYLLYEHTPPVSVGNKQELDRLVHTYLTPYFKKYTGIFNEFTALKISLFSDINGVIQEVRIAYPIEVGVIPATTIEEFEAAVLQSSVNLVFDKTRREFQGTAWVGQYAIYDPDKLRLYIGTIPDLN